MLRRIRGPPCFLTAAFLGGGGKLDEYNYKFPSVTGMRLDGDAEGSTESASAEDGGMIVDLDS